MQLKTIIWQGPLAAVLAAGVFACASPSGGASSRTDDRVETVSIESQTTIWNITLRPDFSGSRASLEFPANKVWDALPTAYKVLPIPVDGLDSTHRFISGSALAYRQLLRRPVSQFIDCGSTIVGLSADSYNLRLSIKSQVDSLTPSTSSLRTWVDATGSSSGGTVRCTSSGELERLIKEQVRELLGGSGK